MRGEVLHFDNEHGFGFITGADGKRYTFEKTDLRREFPVSKGVLVEFQPDEDKARDIFSIRGQATAAAGGEFGRFAVAAQPVNTGLWSYFWNSITANYANFRDRARRKEYWGFVLFYYILLLAAIFAGLAVDQAMGNLDAEKPIVSIGISLIAFVASIVPWVAITVRRQHDIGLSGWFFLLILIPYIGGLIIFVFSLIPSQKHENKWGPVPYGMQV